MADSVKIQIDLATNPAAAKRLEEAFKNLGSAGKKAGRDAASGFDGASARMDAFGKKLGGLKTLFAAAFAGVGINAVLDATREQEAALAQLDAALKSTGNAAGLSRQQYIDLSTGLQQVSTYGDEAILSAENLLLTFRRVRGQEFVGATKAVLDMATALHTDLNSAAQQVGKALNDPVQGMQALRRVGITFTAQQQQVIKSLVETGDVAKAQQIILGELSARFGGSATAATNTFSGALAQLKNAFGDLLEGSGGGFDSATTSIQQLTKTLQDPAIQQGFATMINGLATLAGYAAKAGAEFANLSRFIGEQFARSQGIVSADDIAGIEQQIARLQKIVDNPSPFNLNKAYRDEAQRKIDELKKLAAQYQKTFVTGFVKPKPQDLTNPALAPSGKQAPILPLASTGGADKTLQRMQQLQQAWAALGAQVNDITAQVGGPAQQAWAKYAETVAKAAQAGGAVIAKGGDVAQVQALVQQIMQQAAIKRDDELRKAAEQQGAAQQEVLAWIQQTRAELDGPTAVAVKAYTDKVAELRKLLDAGSITQDVFSTGVQTARDRLLKATQSTTDQVSEFWKQAARNSQDALAQFLFDPFQDGLRGMVRGVADAIRKIAAQMLASNIFKALGSYGSSQGGALGAALSMFGSQSAYGNVFRGGALIPHAAGDVIGNPTVFPMAGGRMGLMGEAGPEAIMPLLRTSTGHLGVRASGGGGTAIRIVNVVDPQATVDAMASSAGEQVIVNAIKRNAVGVRQLLGVR